MFELIINILLFIFFGYTFFTHVLEAAVPAEVSRDNPYALQPDVWPKAIIILLEICLIVNIIKIIKKNKGKPEFHARRVRRKHPRRSSKASCSSAL